MRDWEARFAPVIIEQLRSRRSGKAGKSWYCDETYVKVNGKWCYLYRAIVRDGNLVDSMLSEHRDMQAARRFFQEAKEVTGCAPERVTTEGHDSYPRAIRRILGRTVEHRTNKVLNNRMEQDHRGIKQRYYSGSFMRSRVYEVKGLRGLADLGASIRPHGSAVRMTSCGTTSAIVARRRKEFPCRIGATPSVSTATWCAARHAYGHLMAQESQG